MTITERKYENKLVIIVLSIIIVTGITAVVFFLHLDNIMIINRGPFLKSPYNKSLRVELVAEGLSSPTSMAFVGGNNNNILILEKAKGTVRLVSNGSLKEEPILKVNVDAKGERGLLGVATKIQHNSNRISNSNGISDVFLYYTQADPLRNRIYQYQLKNGNIKLVNPKLILDLPAEPGPYHQGGKLKFGQNNKFLYAVIGDLNCPDTKLQNYKNGKEPNDTSVILKIYVGNISSHTASIATTTTMGSGNMQSNKYSSYYYAYGIRNSFGLGLDPVTGSIWDTENGEHTYDELNLVKPGFNSGWRQIMGPIDRNNNKSRIDLVNFAGSNYADPVFSWKYEIGVTDIEFLNSSKLGQEYKNNIFVGDINYGNLYYFEVNGSRTGIKLNPIIASDGLSDLVADDRRESSPITFGANFGRITDIETGPDGFLYILSYDEGKLYRILPS
jgi:aldose sugar dehydrogenase